MAAPVYTIQVQVNPTQTIALRLPLKQAPNDMVPYELQQYYSRDIWLARQRAVLMKGSRYLKPRFEIFWAVFMVLAMLAVPIVTYYLVLNALPVPANRTPIGQFDGHQVFEDNRPWQARGASLGALIGLILLGWVPFYAWKAHGKRQVNQMLRKFSAEDAAVAGPNVQVPQWSMKMPGMGSKALHILISYPRPMVTPFQVGLPPYLVNPPMDPTTGGYYVQPNQAAGQPHHAPGNAMAGVPLYNERDEKVPDYTGPMHDTYLLHEKEVFEDIKV